MTKDTRAKIVTAAVLAAALGLVLAQRSGWSPSEMKLPEVATARSEPQEPQPQDTIYKMLDAARDGDINAYLGCYTGQMDASLRQSLAESTPDAFAKYLRESNAAIKGIAITEPQTLNAQEVKVRVEYVYQDRNEAQFMYLERQPDGWKIARVDGAERVKTLVPYGTPVQ